MRTVTFLANLDLEWDNDSGWIVLNPMRVVWQDGETVLYDFTVPKGFTTDLSSIPERLRGIIPQVGKYNRPSVAHDYAYEDGVKGMSRREADLMFRDGMRGEGVSWHRRWLMWAAVRAFGWTVWG